VMYGSVTVAVRGMTATESTNTLLMWQMVTIAVIHSFLLLFGFRWPTPADAAMLVGTSNLPHYDCDFDFLGGLAGRASIAGTGDALAHGSPRFAVIRMIACNRGGVRLP
jgi:hypothetical protein